MSPNAPRLLVTGGSGYLGSHLIRAASGWERWATFFSRPIVSTQTSSFPLDLSDSTSTLEALRRLRPDAIIHTALSNATPEQVRAIPAAARSLAEAARELNARLVHVSTDLIWDGERAPYRDTSPPCPIHEYGAAKAEAEGFVSELCPGAVIVRPSLIWGLNPIDRQTRWLVDDGQAGKRVTLFTDEIRCPVWVHDLSAALLELAGSTISGRMNLAGPQPLNRWEFGQRLLAALGLAPMPNVLPSTVAEAGMRRAKDLTMLSERASLELKTKLRSVDEVLGGGASGVRLASGPAFWV